MDDEVRRDLDAAIFRLHFAIERLQRLDQWAHRSPLDRTAPSPILTGALPSPGTIDATLPHRRCPARSR
jgi:hypothetical protein